jgi:hypothetical protein
MKEFLEHEMSDDELADLIMSVPEHFVDWTVTVANVAQSSGGTLNNSYLAGVTVLQGQVVYLNTATSKWSLAIANSTALAAGGGTQFGIALNSALLNQPLTVFSPTVGSTCKVATGIATTIVGVVAYVSAAGAGGIAPFADIAATNYYTVLGWFTTTAGVLDMVGSQATGLVKA